MDETRIALARETLRHWTSMVRAQDFHPPLPCEDALAIMVTAYDELKAEKPSLSRIENKISEIQSAEEFAKAVLDGLIREDDEYYLDQLQGSTYLIRARDKAIVERIREQMEGELLHYNLDYTDVTSILDDVLRELGGEQ